MTSLCHLGDRDRDNRQLDSEARYRWGSDESRWWLYTWRAQARQASGDCHASAVSSQGGTSRYQTISQTSSRQ